MTPAPITHSIGQAERNLRALLDVQIDTAGLSFPQWTMLVWLDRQGPLGRDEVINRQIASGIATEGASGNAIDELIARNVIEEVSDDVTRTLAITSQGGLLFRPVFKRVSDLTDELTADLTESDVSNARRTLDEISRRARSMLMR